jgi:uncharacterized protein YraI
MRRTTLLLCFAAFIAGAPALANAGPAYVLHGVNIFAGPGNDYPMVARLGPGVRVNVQGCLSDFTWCDVSFWGNRGWVFGGDLGYPYRSGRVPIVEYGPRLGLPVITFSLGSYWDHYYRGRPWYHERSRWERHWNDDRHRHEGRNDWHGDRDRHHGRDDRTRYERNLSNPNQHFDNRTGLPQGPPGTKESSRMSPDDPTYYGSQQ